MSDQPTRGAGLDLPLARATKEQYDRMVKEGLGELDKSGTAEPTFKDRHKEFLRSRVMRPGWRLTQPFLQMWAFRWKLPTISVRAKRKSSQSVGLRALLVVDIWSTS